MNIVQKPLYNIIPTGSEIIYTVSGSAVTNAFNVKYVAYVWINKDATQLGIPANQPTTILKVDPNDAGVGIFDFSSVFDNYVHPDYEGGPNKHVAPTLNSQFKIVDYSKSPNPHSIHLTDAFAGNQHTCNYYYIKFYEEYSTTQTEPVEIDFQVFDDTENILIFNGCLDNTTPLRLFKKDYSNGFTAGLNTPPRFGGASTGTFTTNAPLKQYVREFDFMTTPFLNNIHMSFVSNIDCDRMEVRFYYNGAQVFTYQAFQNALGGYTGNALDANVHFQFYGCGPANQRNALEAAGSFPTNWDYYTIQPLMGTTEVCQLYEFHKQGEDCKGFETIRLTWLNQWGGWDYYNFTKKSTKTTNTKPLHYNQYGGTWNEAWYTIHGWKGGKRSLNKLANEEITINTDWITEDISLWLEQLFVSNDVFILKEDDYFDGTGNNNDFPFANYTGYTQKYLEPVIVKSTTNITKTKANDKLIQYSLELEKSKRKRIHRG